MQSPYTGNEIAIVGMAGRFPGAPDLERYWRLLRDGRESVRFYRDDELLALGVPAATLHDPDYVKAGSFIDDPESFDAAFFGLSHREAEITDPQQRIFLECTAAALEDAGYDPARFDGAIGVFAGATFNTYLLLNLMTNPALIDSLDPVQIDIGNASDYLTTRVSYKLNLRGPSHVIQSACSTSLVAVHVACQSLLNDECDLALAGGVSLNFQQRYGYRYNAGGILSPDGHCRPFAADAQGTIFGGGVGVVALKRLDDALNDGDTIHAVILGSAINNDGALKVGYTAPSVDGQALAITEALSFADVDPATISYVEAHGTATAMGDPIEIQALTKAYREYTDRNQFCAIGSVKSNIGHLGAAAGVASLIKTVLALYHGQLPPSLHCTTPSPEIDFANSPFYVNTSLCDWPVSDRPRRAGVSSFGVGGTNAHLILEEAPPPAPSDPATLWQILPLSAKSAAALDAQTAQLAAHLAAQPTLNLADVAWTLHCGRPALGQRRALVVRDLADALAVLADPASPRLLSAQPATADAPVAFLFPGQGAQYVGMARDLYDYEPAFRAAVDQCCALLEPHLGLDLRSVLYPPPGHADAATAQLTQTAITQPALFVVAYALAQLWQAWGVQPAALLGHSLGEYVAATLAGVFTLEDALALVAERGRLMQTLPAGSMLSVALPEAALRPLLPADIDLAAVNGPQQCVVSGPAAAIDALEQTLAARAIESRRLHTSHAFHSAMLDPILPLFEARVRRCRLNTPQRPVVSNVTGAWLTAAQAVDPAYWAQQLRQPVRFAAGLQTLLENPDLLVLEVGPGQTLSTFVRQHPARRPQQISLSSLRHPHETTDDRASVRTALARLWLAGAPIEWAALHHGQRRRRVPLPTYPFERQRYWVEPRQAEAAPAQPIQTEREPERWCYAPLWQRNSLTPTAPSDDERWLIFGDLDGPVGALTAALIAQLEPAAGPVTLVRRGAQFARLDQQSYMLAPAQADDERALLHDLRDRLPNRILHLWSAAEPGAQEHGLHSLIALAQAWPAQAAARIAVVATQLFDVSGAEPIDLAGATLLGAALTLPYERSLSCRVIDAAPMQEPRMLRQLASALIDECRDEADQPWIAYRGRQRWTRTFQPVDLPSPAGALRPDGVYLITGGCSGIGLALAEQLAQPGVRLALLDDPQTIALAAQDARVRRLEAQGAALLAVDVADPVELRRALDTIGQRFGALHGVIHAANPPADATLQPLDQLDPAALARVLRPKIEGAQALLHCLPPTLDFCALDSSLAATIGGGGYAAYAAAGCFLDALAAAQQQQGQPWISIGWDMWRLDGSAQLSGRAEQAISPEIGGELFRRIISQPDRAQIVVSTSDLEQRRRRVSASQSAHAAPAAAPGANGARHARPALAVPLVPPASDHECAIAAIWQQQLGVDQIGMLDNFFDLGGDSFIAVHVIAQIKRELGIDLPVVSLYEGLTVRALAAVVQEHLAPPAAADAQIEIEEREAKAQRRKQFQQLQRSRKGAGDH